MARISAAVTNAAVRIGQYNDQSVPENDEPEFVIPEDLTTLSNEDLQVLREQAVSNFDGLYGDGTGLTQDDLDALAALTEGIESLAAEQAVRDEAEAERAEAAAALAGRVHIQATVEDDEDEDEDEDPEEDDEEPSAEDEELAEEPAEPVLASGRRREVRVPMSSLRNRGHLPTAQGSTPTTMQEIVRAAGEGTGYAQGAGLDWHGVGKVIDRRLKSYNHSHYEAAARAGRHMRQQMSVATIDKTIDPSLVIRNDDPAHIQEVLDRARSESRLPGGSLVAAGGWCAPSVTLYDLLELESRDGLFSLPTVGWARGGINRTLGPDFADIFAESIGWTYTEQQDIDGKYGVDENGVGDGTDGDKPCYRIECTDFEEFRLDVTGLCIQAGLLMARGYPELIARVTRGVLVAHDHKMAARRINAVVAGSDAVTMPSRPGALTPLLDAIEMQVEHMRYIRRLARGTTMEAVFPYWVRGVIRSDLARKAGLDLFSVTDAQIGAWFSSRGISPQFIYNWQDLTGTAASMTAWPATVRFVIYPAGTWLEGTGDVLTLDTIYDSTLLAQNDYTALWTEDAQKVVKMGFDSRVITAPLCPDGSASAGVAFACDGTAAPAPDPVPEP